MRLCARCRKEQYVCLERWQLICRSVLSEKVLRMHAPWFNMACDLVHFYTFDDPRGRSSEELHFYVPHLRFVHQKLARMEAEDPANAGTFWLRWKLLGQMGNADAAAVIRWWERHLDAREAASEEQRLSRIDEYADRLAPTLIEQHQASHATGRRARARHGSAD